MPESIETLRRHEEGIAVPFSQILQTALVIIHTSPLIIENIIYNIWRAVNTFLNFFNIILLVNLFICDTIMVTKLMR